REKESLIRFVSSESALVNATLTSDHPSTDLLRP
ncbi:unnamed protein product, partial [marine sediment metagenome]